MYIIIFVYIVTIFANSYGKYIDLLPDEEKQEFLDRVIRRILENVEVKVNKTVSSGEISDDQLKQHDDFVNMIIKQESEQIRRSKSDMASEKGNVGKLDVRPIISNNNKAEDSTTDTSSIIHVDSVSNKRRRSGDETVEGNSTGNIETDIDRETTTLLQKRSVEVYDRPKDILEETKVINISNAEYNNDTNDFVIDMTIRNSSIDIPHTDPAVVNLITTTELEHSTLEQLQASGTTEAYSNTTSDKFDNLNKNKTIKKDIIYIKTVKSTAINDKQKKVDSFVNSDFKNNITTVNPKTNEKHINQNRTTIATSTIVPESSIKKLSSTLINPFGNDDATEDIMNKKVDNIVIDTQKHANTDAVTTVKTSASTAKTYDISEKSNKDMTSNFKNSKLLSDLASKALKIVKAKHNNERIKLKKEEIYNKILILQKQSHAKNKDCKGGICNRYQVYEVDVNVLDDKPDISSSEPMDEQRYFVPIYEYSPNRAFFDPKNRYGPNNIHEHYTTLNKYHLRKGDKKDKSDDSSEFSLDLPALHKKPDQQQDDMKRSEKIRQSDHSERYFAYQQENEPGENLDFLETNKYNFMGNDLKTHIKAIRDVLSHNKHLIDFGSEDYRDFNKNEPLRSQINNNDLSYFFNRDENLNVKQFLNQFKLFNVKDKYIIPNSEESTEKPSLKEESQLEEKIENIKQKLNTVNGIISVTDEKDIIIQLNKFKDMNLNVMKSNNVSKVSVYMGALRDLIDEDSKALRQYDWLASTVQIRSALMKLKILINRQRESQSIHPSDLQILKYMIFLNDLSSEIRDANYASNIIKSKLLSKNKKHRGEISKDKDLISRVWLYLRTHLPDITSGDEITRLEDFILNIEDHLNDLHEALKSIASITKYKKQDWYTNLKDLYLTTEDKQVGEVLLHLTMSRLVDLIEDSCQSGLENDFVKYMKTHREQAKRTLDETLFVVRIIDDLNKRNY